MNQIMCSNELFAQAVWLGMLRLPLFEAVNAMSSSFQEEEDKEGEVLPYDKLAKKLALRTGAPAAFWRQAMRFEGRDKFTPWLGPRRPAWAIRLAREGLKAK
jgi:hypothetical protein